MKLTANWRSGAAGHPTVRQLNEREAQFDGQHVWRAHQVAVQHGVRLADVEVLRA